MALIIANLEGVTGSIKSGHLEVEISGKRLIDFKNMSVEDQMEYLSDEGNFEPHLISYEYDKITEIKIIE